MDLTGPAKRLTIYIGERDQHGHHSLTTEIVKRAHAAGLAGVAAGAAAVTALKLGKEKTDTGAEAEKKE